MCDKENCNCGNNPCCGDCEPWNCVEQAVNDVWANKETQIEGLVDRAETAAENSEASAKASADSAAEAKEFRDEAETAATTAVAAEGVVLGVAGTLEDTANKLKQIADELGTAIAGVSVVTWYYTAVSDNQTVIPVPADKNQVDVQAIYIEGARQEPNRGFTYDAVNKEITLAEGIPMGMEISIIIGTYSDNPNDFANTLASSNGASLIGTSSGNTVQEELNSLGNSEFRTLQEVARAYNVPNSQVILSTDASTVLDPKTVIYDVSAQKAWTLPSASIPSGATITSVNGNQLTYDSAGTAGTVTLLDPPGVGAETIKYNGFTIKVFLDSYFNTKTNVKDPKFSGGAKGNWNATTLTGADDSAAFQAAINSLTNSYRNGGYRIIYVPTGNYKVSGLVLQAALEFGVMFVGDGKYSSILWGDETSGAPIIDSKIEFVHFHGLSLYGSRKQTGTPSEWSPVFYKGKHFNNAADIDVTFTDCALGHSVDFVEAHGRGVVIDPTCVAFFCTNLVNIVADPDIVFVAGHATNAAQTGMRNYSLCPSRTDVVSRMFRVTGTAYCKDFINDINIKNVDMLSADLIGQFTDATITGLNVIGVSGLNSFASGLVDGKRLLFSTLDVNTAKQYNRDATSTGFMFGIVKLSQGFQGLRIRGFYRDLVRYAVQIGSVSAGLDIDIQAANIAVDNVAFNAVTGSNVISSKISIITTGTAPTAACAFFTSVQTDPKFICNAYGANFVRPGVSFNPNLLVGGTVQTPVGRSATYRIEGGLVYADIAYTYTRAATSTSQISISLPVAPAAEYPALFSAVSGRVHVKFSSLKTAFRGEIIVSSSSIVFYKPDGSNLTEADLPSTFTITLQAVYPAY